MYSFCSLQIGLQYIIMRYSILLVNTGLQPVTRHYYYVGDPKTWFDAQSYCRARFTDLATVDNFNDVNSLLKEVPLGYSGSSWIGLSRGTLGQWGWSRGDEPLSNYSNWDAGRPDGSGQCVANINNVWHDYDCATPLYFVCYYGESPNHLCTNVQLKRMLLCHAVLLMSCYRGKWIHPGTV